MSNIQKLQLEDRIRILCLKHACNVEMVAKEGNVSQEYVRKIIAKIKRKHNEDVNAIVGDNMTKYIVLGTEQRKAWLLEELQREGSKQIELKSCCCSRPVKVHNWDGEEYHTCTKCGKDCESIVVDPRNHNLIIKLIAELRAEDESLVAFLERLGFVVNGNKENNPGTTINNFNVALAASKLGPEDQKTLAETEQLDPRTRESLRKDIEKRIIDAEFGPQNG